MVNDDGTCCRPEYSGSILGSNIDGAAHMPYCPCGYGLLGNAVVGYVCWTPRADDVRYKIKIEVPGGVPESATILRSTEPGKTAALVARVYDQNNQLVPNVNVKLEVDVTPNSGGHQHPNAPNRPKGSLSNGVTAGPIVTGSTGNGGMPFTFLSPAPAGDHKITAACTDRTCTPEGPNQMWVGVCPTCSPKGLRPIPANPNYVLIPNADTFHPDNHYLTLAVSGLVRTLANVYRSRFTNDPVLHLNDASLERGGLFDNLYDGRLAAGWWKPPHPTHRKGTDIDIRWNPTKHPTTSIPDRNVDKFKKEALDLGGKAVPAYVGTDNQHFHVEFGE
jgi:hypothetical protein